MYLLKKVTLIKMEQAFVQSLKSSFLNLISCQLNGACKFDYLCSLRFGYNMLGSRTRGNHMHCWHAGSINKKCVMS